MWLTAQKSDLIKDKLIRMINCKTYNRCQICCDKFLLLLIGFNKLLTINFNAFQIVKVKIPYNNPVETFFYAIKNDVDGSVNGKSFLLTKNVSANSNLLCKVHKVQYYIRLVVN